MPKTFQEQQRERDTFWDATIGISRTKQVIERLLGWECFTSWEAYHHKYAAQEYVLGAGVSYTTPTPTAFAVPMRESWEFRVFSPDHEELTFFKPQESFDDAWQLMQALITQQGSGEKYKREDFAEWEPKALLNVIYAAISPLESALKYEALKRRLDQAETLLEKVSDEMALENRRGTLYREIIDYFADAQQKPAL